MNKFDLWWCSLKTNFKEHIASKIEGRIVEYPEATEIWSSLDESKKQIVHAHCTDSHGMTIEDWQEGESYSY